MYVWICVYIYMDIYIYICMYLCTYVRMYVHTHIYIYVSIIWGFHGMGVPENGWSVMENPIQMDDDW